MSSGDNFDDMVRDILMLVSKMQEEGALPMHTNVRVNMVRIGDDVEDLEQSRKREPFCDVVETEDGTKVLIALLDVEDESDVEIDVTRKGDRTFIEVSTMNVHKKLVLDVDTADYEKMFNKGILELSFC